MNSVCFNRNAFLGHVFDFLFILGSIFSPQFAIDGVEKYGIIVIKLSQNLFFSLKKQKNNKQNQFGVYLHRYRDTSQISYLQSSVSLNVNLTFSTSSFFSVFCIHFVVCSCVCLCVCECERRFSRAGQSFFARAILSHLTVVVCVCVCVCVSSVHCASQEWETSEYSDSL